MTTDAPTPMQTARRGVRSRTELAAGVELGEDDLDAAQTGLRLDVDGDAAGVVTHLDTVVGVQEYGDLLAVAAERLIHRVVDDLPEAVHESARVGRADVHAWTLANRLETLEHGEVAGGVIG